MFGVQQWLLVLGASGSFAKIGRMTTVGMPGVLITLCNHPSHGIAMVGFIGLPRCQGVAMEDSCWYFLMQTKRFRMRTELLLWLHPEVIRVSYFP